jgi:hypothetical protein
MKLKDFVKLLTIAMEKNQWENMPVIFDAVDKQNNMLSTSLEYTSMMIKSGYIIIHVEDRYNA